MLFFFPQNVNFARCCFDFRFWDTKGKKKIDPMSPFQSKTTFSPWGLTSSVVMSPNNVIAAIWTWRWLPFLTSPLPGLVHHWSALHTEPYKHTHTHTLDLWVFSPSCWQIANFCLVSVNKYWLVFTFLFFQLKSSFIVGLSMQF